MAVYFCALNCLVSGDLIDDTLSNYDDHCEVYVHLTHTVPPADMSLLPSLLCLLVCGVCGCVGVSITSENVNCTAYAPHCADMCPTKCPDKTKKLYIQV